MFLLDTSVVSELCRPRPHGAVLEWYRSYSLEEFALPPIALYEMQAGVELTRARDGSKAEEIERWLDGVTQQLRVLSLDGMSARLTAKWMHGKSADFTEDAMIAAIGFSNRLTVATRNVRHFEQFPISIINPFGP